jgi:long-chain acyl-CoA synthetase
MSYADKPWLQHYGDIPTSLEYPDHPLHAFLEKSAAEHPNQTAIITSLELPLVGRRAARLTYAQLNDLADRLAAGLARLGVRKGDRVALLLPNCAQFVVAFYATLKAGGVVTAINPTDPHTRMREQLEDSGAETIIVLSSLYGSVKQIQAQTRLKNMIVTNIKEFYPPLGKLLFTPAVEKKHGHYVDQLTGSDVWLQDVLARYAAAEFIACASPKYKLLVQDILARYAADRPKATIDPSQDICIFQYTGDTTGVPKAAKSTHRALLANTVQMAYWLQGDSPGYEEVFLAAIPLSHVYGMVTVISLAVSLAATMVMVPNAHDIDDLLGNIHTFRPTLLMGVPELYGIINHHPDVLAGKYDLSSIRACVSGSAPLPPETKRRFDELTGGSLLEGHGLSETSAVTHCNPLRGENRARSVGLPLPDVECRIISLDDGETDVPVGEPGELIVRCPQMMVGYHNMPSETANALRGGWLYTSDIAYMDEDGYFHIVDRKKDMH